MESWQDEIIKAQVSQEIGVEMSMENSDVSIFLKSFKESLLSAVDRDSFDKSWSSDLQSKFPNGSWRTVNGARVFINNGKVVAGLDGFNGEIDKFFADRGSGKKEKKSDLVSMQDKLEKLKEEVSNLSKEIDPKTHVRSEKYYKKLREFQATREKVNSLLDEKKKEREGSEEYKKEQELAKQQRERELKRKQRENEVTSATHEKWERRVKRDVDSRFEGRGSGNVPTKQSRQGEEESSLSDTEKLFFDNAAKKYPELDKNKTIEIRDKIISADNGTTSSINALAEAINYSSSSIDDHFDEGNHAIKMAISGKETGHPQAERVLEIGIGGELSKKAKGVNDKFLNVRQKTKTLSDSSKTLLRITAERNELSLSDVNEIVNNMKGTEPEEISEAISKFLTKDMPDISTDKSVTLDTFKDIAKKSKDVDDFIKKTMAVKNVPPEVAKEFFDKYGKGKSQKDAALTFMKEHGNKGEANIDLKKQVKQVREGKKKEVDLPL